MSKMRVVQVARPNGPFEIAERDPATRVRVQAVRAIADLFDPILVEHRIEPGRGDPKIARRLAALGRGPNPRMRFEATDIALVQICVKLSREVNRHKRDNLVDVGGHSFLVYPNYETILDYNCAHLYALSVAMLADRLQ